MKTAPLNLFAAAALGFGAIATANAAPADCMSATVAAYEQGGNSPFPAPAPEVRDESLSKIASRGGDSSPYPISIPDATVDATVIAYERRGNMPFPAPASEAIPLESATLAYNDSGSQPYPAPAAEAVATA